MSRPLALIEGDLTIPLPRPFDGLPPPFGSRYRALREAVHRAVSEIAEPARARRFPPGVKHVLFYKAPPQRVQNHGFDAAMAEAKRYLAMSNARPRSSRSDHILAGAIFTGCSIALTWLLVTCSMKDAEKPRAAAVSPAVAAWKAEIGAEKAHRSASAARSSDGTASASRVSEDVSANTETAVVTQAGEAVLKQALPATGEKAVAVVTQATLDPKSASTNVTEVASAGSALASQVARTVSANPAVLTQQVVQGAAVRSAAQPRRANAVRHSYAVPNDVALASSIVSKKTTVDRSRDVSGSYEAGSDSYKSARLVGDLQVDKRAAATRVAKLASDAVPKSHADERERVSQSVASTVEAPWLNWSAQQNRAVTTVRAAVPVPGDNSWNDHMTQRRITDDPDAFHVERGGK